MASSIQQRLSLFSDRSSSARHFDFTSKNPRRCVFKHGRSQAEKHFARNLERHGVAFQYEPVTLARRIFSSVGGFKALMGYKDLYTPDFYLPELDLYIEIKSQDKPITPPLLAKYRRFGSAMAHKEVKYAVVNMSYANRKPQLLYSNFGYPGHASHDLLDAILAMCIKCTV
ncbi:hypothetical protein K0504_10180 [Neiella marina]|uniref:Endonuclease n=1 Tax=Neiella holothuriorum TaxID=2870530 RepID=A0ABS7EGC9_9GAMM|nr:hypothetical protein [Neiella holothuriorum]MBW8191406.1 hypothetical protein [Neiella holothuriorum]